MGNLAKKQDKKYTYADYLMWPQNERWEVIDGIAYDMTPAPSRKHQRISVTLTAFFYNFLSGKPCEVYNAPFDVLLPTGNEKVEDIEAIVQPDIVVICDKFKLNDTGCKGAPNLIVEIISPYTAKKDMKEKLNLYERVGVKEYWIVDPNNKTVMIYKLDENNRYGRPETYSDEDSVKVGIFEELIIDLSKVFEE